MTTRLVDEHARARILTDLDTNLFVEAGAGAGKTTSLVGRVANLVDRGVEIESIAAITFTEKAAAELRHRLRAELLRRLASADHPASVQRFERGLDRLDFAPIGTLHSFARRLLNEFPVEAGLPPGFAVLDEIQSGIEFDERWERFLDELLADTEPADGLMAGGTEFVDICEFESFTVVDRAPGVPSSLRRLAADFHANWDLVEQLVDLESPGQFTFDLGDVERCIVDIDRLAVPPDDTQVDVQASLRSTAEQPSHALGTAGTATWLTEIVAVAKRGRRLGNKKNWASAGLDLDDCRTRYDELLDAANAQLGELRRYRQQLIGAVLGRWVLDGVEQRRRDGTIEFHDLLVHARHLLTTRPHVRSLLHRRYERVLLDEFQDTDPIQLAIAVRLTAAPDDPAHEPGRSWRKLRPLAGRLFIVGDPKQSIYRFRRADIAQYLRAADEIGSTEVSLTSNFRSSSAVVDWVNQVFARVIEERTDSQPPYQHLDMARPTPNDHGTVTVVGPRAIDDDMAAIRDREASEVVDVITTALAERWPVGDPDADAGVRPCRPGDVCILLPSRASLPALERELHAAGVPYRAENSSVVYETAEIRALMLALTAIDDLTDELALVASLRTPLFGVSDVELLEWRRAGGSWNVFATVPDGCTDHPVANALADFRMLAERRAIDSPAELLQTLVDRRRVLDSAIDGPDLRDVWRRVRFVIEQARAWNDAGGHGLRRYRRWVTRQAFESRSADTVLPETDHDAVRIMTVHAAKGLEFPITVLSGMSTKPQGARAWTVVWGDDSWTLADRDDQSFNELAPIDEQMSDDERRRLLYVACTRAVDHLVVSMYHKHYQNSKQQANGELLVAADAHELGAATIADQTWRAPVAAPAAGSTIYLPDEPTLDESALDAATWTIEREHALRYGRRRLSVSATALASAADVFAPNAPSVVDVDPGLAKDPVDIDLPPWKRGRYGTAIGRAVHAVLQYCDLEHGADIYAHAVAQCAAEGIYGFDATVAALAKSAVDAPLIRNAVGGRLHRELYVASGVDDIVFEGYIDLFIENDEGGLIVDYKTDQWVDRRHRDERLGAYRLQLATYGVALERVLGRAPAGAVLLRCRPGDAAEEIEVPAWPDALAQARRRGIDLSQPVG